MDEIMVTENVMETTEEIATAGLGKGLKTAAGIGLIVFASVIAYRYIAKPMIAKIKNKKNQQEIITDFNDDEDTEIIDEN